MTNDSHECVMLKNTGNDETLNIIKPERFSRPYVPS